MNDEAIPQTPDRCEIDERWMKEWVEFGFEEMRPYLARHNEFRTYCENPRARLKGATCTTN